MADTISYQYAALSALQRAADQDELCLAKYSEIEKKDAPCFFWGKLTQPYMPHRSVQRNTIQFQPDSRPTFDTESPNCDSK